MNTQEFSGIFLGFCTCLFGVFSTMKAAQEIRGGNFCDAIDDLKRCGWASIFTWLCMLGAIINLNEGMTKNEKKLNSAIRKKTSEIALLKNEVDPNQDRWIASDSKN